MTSKPNLLFLTTDQQRFDTIQALGARAHAHAAFRLADGNRRTFPARLYRVAGLREFTRLGDAN